MTAWQDVYNIIYQYDANDVWFNQGQTATRVYGRNGEEKEEPHYVHSMVLEHSRKRLVVAPACSII